MATTIANLKTVLSADASQFNKTLTTANDKLGSLQSFASNLNLGSFLSGAAIGGALQASIAAAEESFEVQKRLEAVLDATGHAAGFSAEQLLQYADSLSRISGIDDEAIANAESMLATFKGIKGAEFTRAVALGLDLARAKMMDVGASAQLLGKALNEPGEALGRLAKAGVVFDDSQRRAIKSMVEMGDTAGAQKVILDALADTVGGSAAKMRSSWAGLKVEFGNTLEAIGKVGSTETSGGFVDWVSDALRFYNKNLTNYQTLIKEVVGLGKDVFDAIAPPKHVPIQIDAAMQPPVAADMLEKLAPSLTADQVGAIEDLEAALKKQIATFGMSTDEVKLWQLEQAKIPAVELEAALALMAESESLRIAEQSAKDVAMAHATLQRSIDSTIKSLNEQSATLGMSSSGLTEWKLRQSEATEEEINYARSLAESNEHMKKLLSDWTTISSSSVADAVAEVAADIEGLNDAFEAGTLHIDAYNEAMDKLQDALGKKLEDAGKRLHESLRTPLEKAEDDIRDLNALLENEAVTAEDYQRRLEEIRQTLSGPDLMDLNTSNPALEFGTAAAFSASRGGSGMERREVEDAKSHEKLEDIKTLLGRIEQATKDGGKVLVRSF